MSGNYLTQRGRPTTSDDPNRLLWYSTRCTYWTDDWSFMLLTLKYKIPCCPNCGSAGFQITAFKWDAGIESHDAKNPGYKEFYASIKNTCLSMPVAQAWEQYRREKGL